MQELETAKLDFLTKCYMREHLAPVLERLVIEDKAFDKQFAILLLDIDHFKQCNDKYGHLHGDAVLKFFSSSLRLGLEGTEKAHIFRLGGDEFVVVFPGKSAAEVARIAGFLRFTLKRRPLLMNSKLFNVTFSGGIASSHDGRTPDDIIACADKAMYVSKKHGRARSTVYEKIWAARMVHLVERSALTVVLLIVCILLAYHVVQIYLPRLIPGNGHVLEGSLQAKKGAAGMATIYLKSGKALKGVIVKESSDFVEILLALGKGSGTVTVKRSLIQTIVRGK